MIALCNQPWSSGTTTGARLSSALRLLSIVALCLICTLLLSASQARSLEIIKVVRFSGWIVGKVKSAGEGVSCQAIRCNAGSCQNPKASADFKLFGSIRRNAITPSVGAEFADHAESGAILFVGGLKPIRLKDSKNINPRYIAVDESDDAKIVRELTKSNRTTVIFQIGEDHVAFDVKAMRRVMRFFETQCGISIPD